MYLNISKEGAIYEEKNIIFTLNPFILGFLITPFSSFHVVAYADEQPIPIEETEVIELPTPIEVEEKEEDLTLTPQTQTIYHKVTFHWSSIDGLT